LYWGIKCIRDETEYEDEKNGSISINDELKEKNK
jgi:hypothetical protein